MSGIEVVGLVLGVLPLAIEGVQSYAQAFSTTERFFHPKRELRRLQRTLETENQIFQNSCALLLRNITNDAEMALLLEKPEGEKWRNPELETQLKKSLGKSYPACCATMKRMKEAIEQLTSHVGIQLKEGGITQGDLRSFHKVKFSMNRARYEDLVQRIKEDNNAFHLLTRQSMLLEPIQSKRRRRSLNFHAMREEANRLFGTVDHCLQCDCRPKHSLCLCLESAVYGSSTSFQGRKDKEPAGQRFVLAFDPTLDTRLAELEIVALKSAAQTGQAFDEKSHTRVKQLCSSMLPSTEIGQLLLTEPGTNRQHTVITYHRAGTLQTLSLQDASHELTDQSALRKGSVKRRMALTVASSVLQLYQTPWLQDQFERNDLAFVKIANGSLLVSPLISKQFQLDSANNATKKARFSDPLMLLTVRNSCLYTLGIFLIELCFGKSMQELQEPGDQIPGGMLEFLPEFRAAKRLIDCVYEEAGKRYGDAVRRCIYCDFDQREYNLDDEKFCQAVYEGVVVPLEENVKLTDGPEALQVSPFSHVK